MATVLIVEDQAQILMLVQSLLEEEGHKIFTAPNVDEALAILAGPEPVDALLVDIILNQDMQAGIELAKRAVALKPGLKVVYSTGLTLTDHVKALLVPGAVVLEKPYKLDQLLTSLLGPSVRDKADASLVAASTFLMFGSFLIFGSIHTLQTSTQFAKPSARSKPSDFWGSCRGRKDSPAFNQVPIWSSSPPLKGAISS